LTEKELKDLVHTMIKGVKQEILSKTPLNEAVASWQVSCGMYREG
jgi:hypothetical protein